MHAMASTPHSEPTERSTELEHRHEKPEDWGWHAEFGRWRDVAGWITVVILLLMMTATHYNRQGTLFLGLIAGFLVVGLVLDRSRRKNAWRK
jgi:uncharacterized protein DUF2631